MYPFTLMLQCINNAYMLLAIAIPKWDCIIFFEFGNNTKNYTYSSLYFCELEMSSF